MPRANRRRTPPQFLPEEISKFSDAIIEKINSKTVQGPSKPGQHLLISLRHRELGIRTKNASNMEIFDCVLRTPSRCYRTTDEISGTKMVYSKRGHLIQCHLNPTLFSKDNLYKKWECFQYLPGEKYRAHHFVDVPYDSQKNTASESYLVIRTSFERLFFIDCENELVLKVYQLPNTNFFTYTGFVYSVLKNELYIKGTKKAGRLEEQPIVAVFELSPTRLKMFYEMERQSVYDYIISVFDGYLASYTAGKFQVHDLDEIYKQYCFDIDELPPVDGVIPVKRNVHVRTVDPSLNIEGEMNENMRFLGGVLFLDRLLSGQSNKFRSLKDPTVNLSLESRCSSSEIGAVLMPIDESQMAGVSYESRTFAFKGTLVSCYNIENRTGTKLYCNKCWSQDFGFPAVSFSFSNELNGEDFLQCSSAFQQLYTEGPHVYIAMEYSMVNLLDGSQCSSTAIFVTSLETGEILKTLLVDVTPKSHYSSIETRSLMLTDEGEICYQSQEYDGVATISLFSLTDQEALNDTEKKLKKATASVERGLNRRQRRQQRRNTSAT